MWITNKTIITFNLDDDEYADDERQTYPYAAETIAAAGCGPTACVDISEIDPRTQEMKTMSVKINNTKMPVKKSIGGRPE